ncbi:hypothetical protein LTR62_003774 [Meristemomyces frigidus]|uniref:Serine-threonine protein kinase 19 n=1 Tax=Meristemomyces frigidus TaxID=1508187 RepID=A0AAN7YRL7_9PEZI|nr:hypothetical protein LTR62_003774 [Meristemomyces frigidus]
MPKEKKPAFLRKKSSSSSPFSALPRIKPSISRVSSSLSKEHGVERLQDTGLTPSLAPRCVPQDVLSLIRHIQAETWHEIPSIAGMGSQRISEVLRFRDSLPPVVSVAHIYALSTSATVVEREMVDLVRQGILRKVVIPGRGKGGSAVGEGVAVVQQWKDRVRRCEQLDEHVKNEYVRLMDIASASATTTVKTLEKQDIAALVHTGFLTNPGASASSTPFNLFASPSTFTTLATAGHTAATGSLAAIGGANAFHDSGGGSGGTLASPSSRNTKSGIAAPDMTFSLPHTGAYLKLLTTARLHLLTLLKQLSPKHKECTMEALREKWEGNVLGDGISEAKRSRNEFRGVLPGKTKAWREFYGVRFGWVLEEAGGGGVVEVFDCGVGVLGVRGR